MYKDALAATANQSGGKWYSRTARGTSWTLFFGAMAGAAVGVLHLAALANGWKLENAFEIIDAPIAEWNNHSLWIRFDFSQWLPLFRSYLAWPIIHLYWTLIGMFLALLFCLARDRWCRRALLFGACGGIVIGCLNLLAIVHQWFWILRGFDFLDRPAQPMEDDIQNRIEQMRLAQPDRLYLSTVGVHYGRLAYLLYWFAIGLLVASLICIGRILVKRKAASEAPPPEERFSAE